MGSPSSFARQCLLMAAIGGAVALAAGFFDGPQAALWCVVGTASCTGLFALITLRRHREIVRLASEVDEVLHNGRRLDFSSCREGDVASLSNELDKMVGRLARTSDSLAKERNALADSLADVSHQIRTPLTAIGLMLPAIERTDDPAQRRRMIRELESMLDRMAWLVTTLLKIAKLDAGAWRARTDDVSAAAVVRRAVAPLATAMDLRDVALDVSLDESARFRGDERWCAEALENIVKNCMEHTPAGGRIRIIAAEDALATSITVTDTGPGFAPQDLPRLFDRFYRGRPATRIEGGGDREEDAPHQPEGFGIGLALSLALVSAQEGTIRASNDSEGGARFEISFPKIIV